MEQKILYTFFNMGNLYKHTCTSTVKGNGDRHEQSKINVIMKHLNNGNT